MYYPVEKKSIGRWWSNRNRKESVDKAFVYTLEAGFVELLLMMNFRQLAAV
jgi:hypothetical protein